MSITSQNCLQIWQNYLEFRFEPWFVLLIFTNTYIIQRRSSFSLWDFKVVYFENSVNEVHTTYLERWLLKKLQRQMLPLHKEVIQRLHRLMQNPWELLVNIYFLKELTPNVVKHFEFWHSMMITYIGPNHLVLAMLSTFGWQHCQWHWLKKKIFFISHWIRQFYAKNFLEAMPLTMLPTKSPQHCQDQMIRAIIYKI